MDKFGVASALQTIATPLFHILGFHLLKEMRMSGKMRFLGILALLALLCDLAFAQTETGQVVGTVTDPQEAVVAGAKVTLKNVNTNASRETVTNSNGLYTITNLQPGDYEVKVEAANFAPTAKRV